MKISKIDSIAAPLPEDNIDTDVIYPGRFLLRIDKKGAAECMFYDRRFNAENSSFVLDAKEYQGAQVLVAGNNFGCGSSREQAVWALSDFGIRCIIASSFGEIFYSNCFNNQVLPIEVNPEIIGLLLEAAEAKHNFQIDLPNQLIKVANLAPISFEIGRQHKEMLLYGLDEIALQLQNDLTDTQAFEAKQQNQQAWLWRQ